ncbi:MAG TPA: ATP-binding protein [Actinomycetes bacterium]|nr:ATP-binding protein [Actinomycetes bacterium]
MKADAWSDWAGGAPEAPPGRAGVPGWPPELDELYRRVVTWAARLVGTPDALLWLVAEDGRRLVVGKGIGRFAGCVGRRLGKGTGLAGEAWRTGTPQGGGQQEVPAALCVPLTADGSVVGVLGMAWREPGRVAGKGEIEQLRGCAELAGVAIDRAGRLAAGAGPGRGWLPGADERYRALSEQIPAVLYSEPLSPEGTLVYESPQSQQLLGYTQEETLRRDFWKTLIHPDDRERVLAENERVDRTGDPWNMEYRVFAKDGRVVWVRDHAVLVRGEHGEPGFWQGYYIDITDQKLAEEGLRQALERERQALERERQAAQELRALDEMKNTFLDAVSHELRTPLATVIGIALTLKRSGSSLAEDDTADLVDRLVVNAGKLDRLLSDLLDLDRLSKGLVEPRRSRTDVAALVGRVATEWRQRSGRRLDVTAEPVVAWVDPAKVERVVENLLANADRHTTPDTPVWVTVARRDGGVLLAVEDAGGGVPRELRSALFEPFRQGPEASAHAPGVGIGLSLVARFAELHGGRAWVQDRPGGGASFRVLLPDPPSPADVGR